MVVDLNHALLSPDTEIALASATKNFAHKSVIN